MDRSFSFFVSILLHIFNCIVLYCNIFMLLNCTVNDSNYVILLCSVWQLCNNRWLSDRQLNDKLSTWQRWISDKWTCRLPHCVLFLLYVQCVIECVHIDWIIHVINVLAEVYNVCQYLVKITIIFKFFH